jgi:hypothetical protein
MSERVPIRKNEPGGRSEDVPAELQLISVQAFFEIADAWGPHRADLRRRLASAGLSEPEHFHWDWGRKAALMRLPGYKCFAAKCESNWQGVIMTLVDPARHPTRLHPHAGEPLVYVDYVEIAPWNLRFPQVQELPKFSGVGTALLRRAAARSIEEEFGGRMGLHSLPQSERFYAEQLGMQALGQDASYDLLEYFAFTDAEGRAFAESGARP